jgi:putative flavoprotein involved in K+ transport
MVATRQPERFEVIVVGGGQSGLAAGYHLARHGIEFAILEADQRIGDVWRSRYDSLLLYSPAQFDELPGLRFPLPRGTYPTGRQMADYLETYADHFDLPVRPGIRVDRLRAAPDRGYVLTAGPQQFAADQVVVASGWHRVPHLPEFAAELNPAIRQLHSADYREPSQLADGPVLVVGLSHSGADIAHELADRHRVIISGRAHGQLPWRVDGRVGRVMWPLLRLAFTRVLTLRTPMGRKLQPEVRRGGGPLLRYRRPELLAAGVELTDLRTTGVKEGKPMLEDGRILEVANVVWCTGFRPNYRWIDLPALDANGWPLERRGVVESVPGLYFVGVPFQHSFASMLVLGAGRDAAHVVERAAQRALAERRRPAEAAA